MPYHLDDTIAAIATASGGAARGIVRVSGSQAAQCLMEVFHAAAESKWDLLPLATCVPGTVSLPQLSAAIPCDAYLWPGERSYTRQNVVELHTLGAPPLLEMLLGAVCAAGARLAEPGEFTLRAFLAGRLDLAQAEAVLGVIDARGGEQLRVALDQLAGGLSRPLHALRNSLLDLLAHLEAGLDFVEDDIEFIGREELEVQLAAAHEQVQSLLVDLEARQQTSVRARVVLLGAPNAGKSSLFNALAGRRAALVSEAAGTTRDYLVAEQQWRGVSWNLVDTAGTDPSQASGTIDAAARRFSDEQQGRADIQLLCLDASRPLADWQLRQLAGFAHSERLVVLTKIDAPRQIDMKQLNTILLAGTATQASPEMAESIVPTSSYTGQGLDTLRNRIAEIIAERQRLPGAAVASTAERCRESLRLAGEALERGRDLVRDRGGDDLIAIEVRSALDGLGQVVGAVYTDDILDRVFSRFCIGK